MITRIVWLKDFDNFYWKRKIARESSLAIFSYKWAKALISSSDMEESQRTLTFPSSVWRKPGTVGIP